MSPRQGDPAFSVQRLLGFVDALHGEASTDIVFKEWLCDLDEAVDRKSVV